MSFCGWDGSKHDRNKQWIGTILSENKIKDKADDQKKYLKKLLKKHIVNAEFVQPPCRIESENVMMAVVVGQPVDFTLMQDADVLIDAIAKLSRTLRNELIEHRDIWEFTGRLNDFDNPPLLQFLLEQLLFGCSRIHMPGRRDDDCRKTVDVLSQVILQNVKTDRQVRYNQRRILDLYSELKHQFL